MTRRLPLIIAIALCLLISGLVYWQIHPILFPFIQGQSLRQQTIPDDYLQSFSARQSRPEQFTNKNHNISSFKLFGDASAPAKKPVIINEKLPETTLKLTLTGVLAGKDNILASALIEGPDRQTRRYLIDEEVPGGATLKQVYPDRVVLDRSGRLENLIFEEKRSIGIEMNQAEREQPEVYAPVNVPQYGTPDLDSFNQQQTQQVKDRLSRLRNRLQSSGQ